jgi:uncharacterized membrane protein YbaN (DUF454 family)
MKELWVIIGVFSLSLGLIGVVLPILPTTPFLLVSAYGFSKGNGKIHMWFQSSKIVKKFGLSLQMTKRKKVILNLFVDGLLIGYMIYYKSMIIVVLLATVIVLKHLMFNRFVDTV